MLGSGCVTYMNYYCVSQVSGVPSAQDDLVPVCSDAVEADVNVDALDLVSSLKKSPPRFLRPE